MKVDITKQQEDKVFKNLIALHKKLCNKKERAGEIMAFTKYLLELLKDRERSEKNES